MLNQLLDLFKENALLGVAGAAVISLYAILLKSDEAVPSLWRKAGTTTTILSMIIGLYWIPSQSNWYLALGIGIILTSWALSTRGLTYTQGSGLAIKEVWLTTKSRITAFLPAVWAPFVLPSLQWFLHRSLPSIFSAPGSANPILHIWKSVFYCLAISVILAASTFLINGFRTSNDH